MDELVSVSPVLLNVLARQQRRFKVFPLLRFLWSNDTESWTMTRLCDVLQELGYQLERIGPNRSLIASRQRKKVDMTQIVLYTPLKPNKWAGGAENAPTLGPNLRSPGQSTSSVPSHNLVYQVGQVFCYSKGVEMDTRSLVEQYVEAKDRAGVSEATLATYNLLLKHFTQRYAVLPMDPEPLEEFVADHKGKSDETAASRYGRLRTFYRWLVRRGLLKHDDDPFIRMEKPLVRRKIPRFLTIDELRKVIEVCRPGIERALILTFIETGARLGELAGRTKDDIQGNTLRINGKTGERLVPLRPEVRAYLLSQDTHYLFPMHVRFGKGEPLIDAPASANSLQRRVRRLLKRAGLRGPKLGPHIFRHSYATHFLSRNGDTVSVSRILGHTSTRMTERYVGLISEDLARKSLEFGPLSALMSLAPAIPAQELPKLTLPERVLDVPLFMDDVEESLISLLVVRDNRDKHIWTYIRARCGDKKWQILSLGADLPVSEVDAWRLAIAEENEWRRHIATGNILVDQQELVRCMIEHAEDLMPLPDADVVTDEDVDLARRLIQDFARGRGEEVEWAKEGQAESVREFKNDPKLIQWWIWGGFAREGNII